MRFLHTPDLPVAKVRLCALAAGQDYIRYKLQNLGVETIEVGPSPSLPLPTACHADLQMRHLGGGRVLVTRESSALAGMLRAQGFKVEISSRPLSPEYPGDIPLCCFALESTLYCNPGYTAPELLAHYGVVAPVRQGYARCSACIVDERALITADGGIAAAAERNGLDVLRIRPGHIILPGYAHGFIGGCAGLLNKGVLAFTGDVRLHPDGERILVFCRDRGVEVLALADSGLLDIGGILPLAEGE